MTLSPSGKASDLDPSDRADRYQVGLIEPALKVTGLTLELLAEVDSTNRVLTGAGHRHRHVVLAEHQTAGRGRRGRVWLSPPQSGLCLSLGYQFHCPIEALGPLSLAMGIAVAETLNTRLGAQVIQLKWPNDLILNGKKLGGLLIEIQPAHSAVKAVIGLGLNVCLPDRVYRSQAALDDAAGGRGWTDLRAASKQRLDRTELAIELALALDRACDEYARSGFACFATRWPSLDALHGQGVTALQADGSRRVGTAAGIRPDGALWLDTPAGRVALQVGEVSIRGR